MSKDYTKLCVSIAICVWTAAGSTADLLVELDASNNPGATGTWATASGTFPGNYAIFSQPPAPQKLTDSNGVTFFSAAPANSGSGFIGGDNTGSTQQAPTGTEPLFVLNGTNPGDFTFEIWARKRGNRIGSDHAVLGMKSSGQAEAFNLTLHGSGADEGRIDIMMKDDDPTTFTVNDVHPMTNNGDDDPFDQFLFTWDNSASQMDIFQDGVEVVSDLVMSNVSLNATSVWLETVFFNNNANDATANNRFNGDIARIRIYDEVLPLSAIQSNFFLGPNAFFPAPADIDSIVIANNARFQFTSQMGVEYFLQFTTDLVNSSQWQNAGAGIEGTGGTLSLYDPAGFSTTKAYRVRAEP